MNSPAVVDTSFLGSYYSELDEIFRAYIDDINPFIIQFEVLKNEFPIELQNEIRAMYGHLARAATASDEETVERNINKIKSHTKRALLDCYKYSCIIFSDKYLDFFERYKGIDLSYIEEGKFLSDIHSLYNNAKQSYAEAKNADLSNVDEDTHFEMYQDAYNKFVAVSNKIDSIESEAAFLKHKATRKDKIAIASFAFGVLGVIVGVLGLFL